MNKTENVVKLIVMIIALVIISYVAYNEIMWVKDSDKESAERDKERREFIDRQERMDSLANIYIQMTYYMMKEYPDSVIDIDPTIAKWHYLYQQQ
jgi:hypothetical protein